MPRPARWLIPEIDNTAVAALSAELGLSLPACRVLWRRGIRDAQQGRRFLDCSLDDVHSPFLLTDMPAAVERLKRAVQNGERILLYGDYDVDGVVSVVLLKKAIEMAGGQAEIHVPHRLVEGYGMRSEIIERAASGGVSLIISADTGIRAAEAVALAGKRGVDVIVTDHHLPEDVLPPARAVLNPNRQDCTYPEKHLCGAGVASKLAWALFQEMGWSSEKIRRVNSSFLKLVAIATVADVVPLRGENRVIVRQGLENLRMVKNAGLRAILETAGLAEGGCPTTEDVSYRIAPRINAAGRMGDANEVVELFLTEDLDRAREVAAKLDRMNQERQQAENRILDQIRSECEREPVREEQAALVFCGEGWHKGVVGIVASRLVERFGRPTFVLSADAETGEASGSGRSVPAFHLLEALEAMPDVLLRFGGHRQAAGVAVRTDRLDEFRRRMDGYASARLAPEDLQPTLKVDALLEFDEISEKSVGEVLSLRPFGQGNPPPLFAVCGAELAAEPVVLKERHLRLKLRQGSRSYWVKAWNFADRRGELMENRRLDFALNFEEDACSLQRGYPGWAMVVRDFRPGTGSGCSGK